jgi:hypothetical protein
MHANGVTADIDPSNLLFHFRLIGAVSGNMLLKALGDAYRQVDDPGEYDHIFDMRRFINIVAYDDLAQGIALWRRMSKRPDATTKWALITDDPLRIARTNAFIPVFPDVKAEVFPKLDDAMTWLRPHPVTAAGARVV